MYDTNTLRTAAQAVVDEYRSKTYSILAFEAKLSTLGDALAQPEPAPTLAAGPRTMTAYRKKPVVIQATQWFKPGDHPAVEMKEPPFDYGVNTTPIPWIKTLEGGHVVTPGDWIITGIKGEHYPCKPDIFAATYELAED